MPYKPGDPYSKEFVTSSPTTGAATTADALPTATATFAGTGTGAMALTVALLDVGHYKAAGTVPGGRAAGDVLNVTVAATVNGVAGKAVVDTQTIDDKTGYALAANGVDLIIPDATSPTLNLRRVASLIFNAVASKLSGVPSTGSPGIVVVRNQADGADRLTVGVDGNGNRTSSTVNPPA